MNTSGIQTSFVNWQQQETKKSREFRLWNLPRLFFINLLNSFRMIFHFFLFKGRGRGVQIIFLLHPPLDLILLSSTNYRSAVRNVSPLFTTDVEFLYR